MNKKPKTLSIDKTMAHTLSEEQDTFYRLKNESLKKVKEILQWANNISLKTNVTMLDSNRGRPRIKSDKNFEEILSLVNKNALKYFRIILRKKMNLFLILTDKKIIKDILEIGICGVNVASREYFIMIYLDKSDLDVLKEKYELRIY